MNVRVRFHLMFEGKAEEAMNHYASIFSGSEILDIVRYGPGEAGAEGSVMLATFSIGGQVLMCIDSYVKHAFTFTPSMSLFVDCDTADEIRRITSALSEGGEVFMPLGDYGFSREFAWVSDRFGVSWQLNLA